MGLKGAGAYFQQMIATIVLAGLLYTVCELYIDDLIIWGRTEEEFLERLSLVLERLDKYRVVCNPMKARLGMSEVEYVGHKISQDGLSFTQEKIQEVLDFAKPVNQQELKKFLGLANYLRDHIRNHSSIVAPLNHLLREYSPKKGLAWTEVANTAFEEIRSAIMALPKLYFIDEKAPIFLHTDASKYGIGAYLFQVIDGQEQPIAFVSKAFVGPQLNWSTPEQEMFAIFFALRKFDYLLRDVQFTLRTDHKNLTLTHADTNAKVVRWKLLLQEYNFTVTHIKGEDNVVADAFSRICTFREDNTDLLAVAEESLVLAEELCIPEDKRQIIARVHNSRVGHRGIDATISAITRPIQPVDPKYGAHMGGLGMTPWLHMREQVKHFIRRCPCCQKQSQVKVPIIASPYTLSSMHPMQRLNIDTIGPLPEDSNNNIYILVVIDCFSRFIELYPIRDLTAETAAKVLFQHFGRYGSATEMTSDNSRQFVNTIIDQLLQLLGTLHTLSLSHSHEENGIVERANKEVMRHLRAIMHDVKLEHAWSDMLPIVMRIFNSEVKEPIGVTPAQILFGNAINLDRGYFAPLVTMDDDTQSHAPPTTNRGVREA